MRYIKMVRPLVLVGMFILFTVAAVALAKDKVAKQSVDFHDIQRDGSASIIGHFHLPIGQIVTLEGKLAKPSKVSDERTLRFSGVNGKPFGKQSETPKWPPLIQIRNVDALPKDKGIVVEGYEFVTWRGTPETNWYLGVEFMITKVVSPKNLELNNRKP